MAASLASLFLVAALLAPLTVLLPHHPGTDVTGVLGVGAAAAAVGGGLRVWGRRTSLRTLEAILVLGTLLTGAAVHATGGVPNAASLLFLWVALYAAYFLPRRRALLHVALIGACHASVIALQPPPFPAVAHWATTLVSILVAALIVASLKARVDCLLARLGERADALLRSARETRLIVDTAQHAYVAFCASGRVLEWNAAAEATFGWTREEAVGMPLESLVVREEDRPRLHRLLADLAVGDGQVPGGRHDAVAVDRDGRELPVEVSLSVLPREGGAVLSAFVSDISDRRRIEEERRRERQFLRALLESLDTGIVACDAEGHLALLNRAGRELHGLPAGPLTAGAWSGHPRLLAADGRTPLAPDELPLARALRGEPVKDLEAVVAAERRAVRDVVCNGRAIVDDAGRRLGAVVAMTDITARKRAETALERRERQLTDAQSLAHVGSWEWDAAARRLEWSEELRRIFGVDCTPAGREEYLRLVHSEDRERVAAALRRVEDGERVSLEHRIVRPDGEIRDLLVRAGRTERSVPGVPVILGACQDVTERKRAERAMARHTEALRRLGELSRDLAGARSTEEAARLAAIAALDLSGAAGASIVVVDADGSCRTLARAQEPGDAACRPAERAERVQRIPATGEPTTVLVLDFATAGDSAPDATLDLLEILAADVGSALERVTLLERLEDAARRDELTGLPNRRVWEEQLPREVARARRSGAPFTVALLDLDHFKAYNDEHGHQAGDRLLARAALAWVAELRPTDLLARYGGEEFGLLLPDCGPEEALVIVDRLRSVTPMGQTCSAGIAVWDAHEAPAAVVARADEALYVAKSEGRDGARVAPPV